MWYSELAFYVHNRGATAGEMASAFACDVFLHDADHAWYRGIDVRAPRATVFRWLTQLRVAPYSYDWIDNLGRQSPRQLLDLAGVARGQRAMIVFEIIDFEDERHLTLELKQPWWVRIWASMVMTYRVDEIDGGCRIVVKMLVRYPRTPLGWLSRWLLPHGDWFMMCKQLYTFRDLAEKTAEPTP